MRPLLQVSERRLFYLMHTNQHKQNEETEATFQNKRTRWNFRENFNGTEMNNLSDKDFKVMATKMLNKLRRKMDDHSDNFNNKEIENIRKHQEEVTELKNP